MRFTNAIIAAILWGPTAAIAQPTFTVVARTGQLSPGAAASYDVVSAPYLNAGGQLSFSSTLTGPGVNAANNSAVFTGLPASVDLLIRSGSPAPGFASGVVFHQVYEPQVNSGGHVLFGATLSGPGIDTGTSASGWLAANGSQQLVGGHGPFNAGDRVLFFSNNQIRVWSPLNPTADPPFNGSFFGGALDPAGNVAVRTYTDLSGRFIEGGILLGPVSDPQIAFHVGQQAPGGLARRPGRLSIPDHCG
jgi:hypothetical protein